MIGEEAEGLPQSPKVTPHSGDVLRANGWMQGSLVKLSKAVHYALETGSDFELYQAISELPAAADGIYVVATQDCDLVADEFNEPFVELILCTQDPKEELRGKSRSGTRWFDIKDSSLVAHSAYRITIRKSTATSLTIEPWPSNTEELFRFRRWLEKRQGRVPLPDEITDAIVKPLRKVIDGNRKSGYIKAINKVVDEIRMTLPLEASPPFSFSLILLMDGELNIAEAEQFETGLNKIRDTFARSTTANLRDIIHILPEDLSVRDYRSTVFVDLDMVTYSGSLV